MVSVVVTRILLWGCKGFIKWGITRVLWSYTRWLLRWFCVLDILIKKIQPLQPVSPHLPSSTHQTDVLRLSQQFFTHKPGPTSPLSPTVTWSLPTCSSFLIPPNQCNSALSLFLVSSSVCVPSSVSSYVCNLSSRDLSPLSANLSTSSPACSLVCYLLLKAALLLTKHWHKVVKEKAQNKISQCPPADTICNSFTEEFLDACGN